MAGNEWVSLSNAMDIRVCHAIREVENLESALQEKRAELRGLREGLECIKSAMPKGE